MRTAATTRAGASPIGFDSRTISVPRFPLQQRCKVCRVQGTHPEVFDELTARLLTAEPRKHLVIWLAKQGVKLSLQGLSMHYQRHLLPYWGEALEVQRRLEIEAERLGQVDSGSIASALALSLAMRGFDAVHEINFAKLGRNANPKLIDSLSRLAETIAKVSSLQTDARLKQEMLKLRQLELIRKSGDLDQVAGAIIEQALRDHPALAQQVKDALASGKARKLLPAPTPNPSEQHAPQPKPNRKASTGRRPRAGRQR